VFLTCICICTCRLFEGLLVSKYRVRHKSVNTPLSHERLVVRTWLAVYALPATTIYCEPGAYDKPFVG